MMQSALEEFQVSTLTGKVSTSASFIFKLLVIHMMILCRGVEPQTITNTALVIEVAVHKQRLSL